MSSSKPDYTPFIALVHAADRALQADMVRAAHRLGRTDIKPAHNALFGFLGRGGDRAAALAARAGITRQSMGEVIRELVGLGILEMVPDPTDRRAKLVRYTEEGLALAEAGFRHIGEVDQRLADEFDAAELELVRTFLGRLVEILDEDRLDESLTGS
jgi:DNA-binding MarR family transcriptional regulator